jgi:hypothetical protein
MGKDAALKILGKRFAHEGLGGVVVALDSNYLESCSDQLKEILDLEATDMVCILNVSDIDYTAMIVI